VQDTATQSSSASSRLPESTHQDFISV